MPKSSTAVNKKHFFAHNRRSALIVLRDIDAVKHHADTPWHGYKDKSTQILALRKLIALYSLKFKEKSGKLKPATPELLLQSLSTFWTRHHVDLPERAPPFDRLWRVGTSEISAAFITTLEHAHDDLVATEGWKVYETPTDIEQHPTSVGVKQESDNRPGSIRSVIDLLDRKFPQGTASPVPPKPSELSNVDTAQKKRRRRRTTRSEQPSERASYPSSRLYGSTRSSNRTKKRTLSGLASDSAIEKLRSDETRSLQAGKGTTTIEKAHSLQDWVSTVSPVESDTLERCVFETLPSQIGAQLDGPSSQQTHLARRAPLNSPHAIHSMMEKTLYRLSSISRTLSAVLRLPDTAEVRFDTHPTDDLCELYRACFGYDWKNSVNALCSKRSRLLVNDVIIAMINAYIHNHVLSVPVCKVPLPPFVRAESFHMEIDKLLRPTGLDWNVLVETALSNTLMNMPEDSAGTLLWADQHARKLCRILVPHIRQNMYLYGEESLGDWRVGFETDLREIFADSLDIWRGLCLSGRSMQAFWPQNCAQVDYDEMKARYSQPGAPANEFKVAFATQSGLRLTKAEVDDGTSGQLVFHKAEVVMQS